MKKLFLFAILCLDILFGALSAVSLVTIPNPQEAQLSQTFQVQVKLDTATIIRGYSIYFSFDSNVIQFTTATRGALFNGQPVGWYNVTTVSPGLVRVECIIFGPGLFVTGPGIILNTNFTALQNGYTTFSFGQVELYDISGAIIPDVTTTNGEILIGSGLAHFQAKCFLQGSYESGAMFTGLAGIIPLQSPYSSAPVTVQSIPSDIVDWMLVELRSVANGPSVAYQSVFLHSDGFMSTLGYQFILFSGIPPGQYYIVLRHRNHIPVMSAVSIQITGSGNLPLVNFTLSSSVFGEGSLVLLEEGDYGLVAGDADGNGLIDQADRNNVWFAQTGLQGYLSADFDLDGKVFPNDLNEYWRSNLGMVTDVP
jgi:hypothetical protein